MLLLIILLIGCGGGLYLFFRYDIECAFIAMVVFGIALAGALIFVPISRMDYQVEIRKYESTVQTINKARDNNDRWHENVSMTMEVIGANRWLEGAKYYYGIFGSVYVPSRVMELEKIE